LCQRLVKRRERKDVNKKMKKETELDREETERDTVVRKKEVQRHIK